MASYDGEQGARVYEHLAGLAPDEGVTMAELMSIADLGALSTPPFRGYPQQRGAA